MRLGRADHALEALIFAILGLDELRESGSALHEQMEIPGESSKASVHLADRVGGRRSREVVQGGPNGRKRGCYIASNLRQSAREGM